MKKIHILCAVALGFAFAACDEVEESYSQPQTSPQEAPFAADQVGVTPDASVIDLAALAQAGQGATVAAVAAPEAPEGYTIDLVMQIAKTSDFSNPVELDCATAADGTVTVGVDELQNAYYENITHDPREAKVNARFAAYAVNGTTRVRMGGADYYYGTTQLTIVPFPAAKTIADAYTLEIAKGGDWASAMKFDFANSGVSVYDDPAFAVTANYSSDDFNAGLTWRIVASTGEIYGPAGAADTKGDLLEGANPGTVTMGAPLLVNIDMLTDTYSYMQAIECFYTPGGANGWNGAASQTLMPDADYTVYTGLVSVTDQGFKVNPDNDWKGRDMGLSGALEESTDGNGYTVYTGVTNGGNNITVPVPGLYWVEYNATTKAIKLTYFSTMGIIGGFNGWAESIALTPSADFRTWTSGAVEFPADCEWKFRANDGWAFSWGAPLDDLSFNGPNIMTAEAGTYIVTLDLSVVPYTAVLTKQ